MELWYTRVGDAEGTSHYDLSFSHQRSCTKITLKALQCTKIEETKKKTNYYTTRNLLERYDEPYTDSS
jgi:endoplasmic reticulum junction formation protein lunapark